MKLAIMQPYLFPYLGYWQLIANTDKFIFFDVVQYNKRSWMNRNRVLHFDENKEFQYITVPVKKHDKGTLISNIHLNKDQNYRDEILGRLTIYKRLSAPHYEEVVNLVDDILSKKVDTLLGLSIYSTVHILDYINMEIKYDIASNIVFDRNFVEGPGDWALSICKSLGANSYINPYGGHGIFDEYKYSRNNVKLSFLKPRLTPYRQHQKREFSAGLSIIDALMFNEPDKVKDFIINDFDLMMKKDL